MHFSSALCCERTEMARTEKVIVTCDLHEGEKTGDDVETIAFSLDGEAYEVDACAEHAAQLRDSFATYVGHARSVGRSTGGRSSGRSSAGTAPRRASRGSSRPSAGGSDRAQVQAIREWARSHGQQVSERGRLSATVLDAYRKAHPDQ